MGVASGDACKCGFGLDLVVPFPPGNLSGSNLVTYRGPNWRPYCPVWRPYCPTIAPPGRPYCPNCPADASVHQGPVPPYCPTISHRGRPYCPTMAPLLPHVGALLPHIAALSPYNCPPGGALLSHYRPYCPADASVHRVPVTPYCPVVSPKEPCCPPRGAPMPKD